MTAWESTRKHCRTYEKCLDIEKKSLPANHPSLATSYNNIGGVYGSMGEYSKALSFMDRALKIRQYSLPPSHPDIQASLKWIDALKQKL